MTMPPAGPPAGYPPNQQQYAAQAPTQAFQPAPQPVQQPAPPSRPPAAPGTTLLWVLSIVSIAAVVLGLTISENGRNAWDSVNAWGAVAIAGAVLTLAPVLDRSHPQRAWRIAACGAVALVFYWVLFTLPGVGTNTSLIVTVGVAAGVISVWLAPGRGTAQQPPAPPTW